MVVNRAELRRRALDGKRSSLFGGLDGKTVEFIRRAVEAALTGSQRLERRI